MAFELIKVSELPELTTPSDPNVLPIQDGDYLKRISFENLKEAITDDVADDLAAEVTARESAVSDEATARGNADAAILADLASAYSASATYAVGDYCIKDGQLYRCTTAISTAEAWTAAHWSAVALGDDTRDLRSALNERPTEEEIAEALYEKADVITNTASGAIANFPDGAAMPVKGLTVNIDPVQSGSGDPSPTNVRPITGWDAVKVTRTGKNLFDIKKWLANIGVSYTENGDYVRFTPTGSTFSVWFPLPLGAKTLSVEFGANTTATNPRMRILSYDGQTNNSITSTYTGNFVGVAFNWSSVGVIEVKAQVEFGSTATEYAPCDSQYVTIQLGQTVYGGTLDVLTGVLTVDSTIVDMGSLNWDYSSSVNLFDSGDIASVVKSQYGAICSTYKWLENPRCTAFDEKDKCFGINKTEDGSQINDTFGIGTLLVKDTAYSDADAFKAAVNGAQLCYKLATPLIIQLTAEQLSTIKGTNNIFADTGDVSVQYGADTKLYIEDSIVTPSLSMIAPIENGTTASQAYTTGRYFLRNNVFCKAKTNIASGATFTLNTNYTETTVAAELYTALH